MKLKWKIFLLSLIFIMAAVGITAITVLHVTFTSAVNGLRQNAAAYSSYFISAVENDIAYQRLRDQVAVLSEGEAENIITDHCSNYSEYGSSDGVAVISSYGTVVGGGGKLDVIKTDALPDTQAVEENKCATCIYDLDGRTYLASSASFFAEETEYTLYALRDVTETYLEYDGLFMLAGYVSIGFAVGISLILFAFLVFLLHPLSKLKRSIGQIADGEYTARAEEKGSGEVREIARDINAMAEAVEDNAKRLEDIADGRKRYVNSLAHEMKTPLTSILCYGDLLRIKRSVEDSERLEYAGVIVDEARRLKNLSSKLLELACADSAELDFERTSVKELLSDIQLAVGEAMEAKKINLTVEGDDCDIYCDRELFKSLMYNLIDNAAKASSEGGAVKVVSRAEKNAAVISVSDRGIGMTRDVLKKVTEPFFMADKSRSRAAGGAGLGLSLCVEIAKRHNARLSAKSKPGVGTTVFVTVPYAEEGVRLIDGEKNNT